MALRSIRVEGDEILKKKSRSIEEINERLILILDDLAETMYQNEGVGLAAPQVGILKRICVIDIGDGLIELINPTIINIHGEQIGFEGCLSIPDTFGEVKRPFKIKIEALKRNGKKAVIRADDLLARAICHEIDHLDGILFTEIATEILNEEELNKRRELIKKEDQTENQKVKRRKI